MGTLGTLYFSLKTRNVYWRLDIFKKLWVLGGIIVQEA
jgi:hypothetical protein